MRELHQKVKGKEISSASSTKFQWVPILLIFTTLIIFNIIMTVYCSRKDAKEELFVDYMVSVNDSTNESYYLLVPIPNISHDITESNGITEIQTQPTEFGDAYNIQTSGPMQIKSYGHEKKYAYYQDGIPKEHLGFSLMNNYSVENLSVWGYDHEFWIYSNHSSNLSLTFEVSIHYFESTWGNLIDVSFTGNITQGWNLISPHRHTWSMSGDYRCGDRVPWINLTVVITSIIFWIHKYHSKNIK
jgi:hypothetical protein